MKYSDEEEAKIEDVVNKFFELKVKTFLNLYLIAANCGLTQKKLMDEAIERWDIKRTKK